MLYTENVKSIIYTIVGSAVRNLSWGEYTFFVYVLKYVMYTHYIIKVIRLFSQNKINFLDEHGIFF